MERPLDRTGRPYADLTGLIDAAGGVSPSSRAEVAAATAAVLVRAGREPDEPGDHSRFVSLADVVGIETLAALWQGSDPVSLPGALWALYLLRQWFRGNGAEVQRLWRAGAPLAPADAVVAGVADFADTDDLMRTADAILAGVYRGDLAVALERAAAVFRVVAAGRRDGAGSAARDADPGAGSADPSKLAELAELAERNDRAAQDLTVAARRWREGTLG